MYDIINDDKWLNEMQSKMKPDEVVFPIAIHIGKNMYKINDISNPDIFKDTSITTSNFKVVFGSIYNMFRTMSFPINSISAYKILRQIQTIDEKSQVDTLFFVFESDYIDNDNLTTFDECINEYYEMLYEYTKQIADSNRKRALQSFFDANNF